MPRIQLLQKILGWELWLTSVIIATWETEIQRIAVQGQLRQMVCETLSQPIFGPGGVHLSPPSILGA
jgi:hypothetical protein